MLKKIHDFLKGETIKDIINVRDYGHTVYYTYYIKIDSGIDNLVLIYKTDSTNKDIIGLFSQLEFVGLYVKNKNIFYSSSFDLEREESIPELKIIDFTSLTEEVTSEIKNKVIRKIGYDENNVKGFILSEEDMKTIEGRIYKEAYEHFMNDYKVDKYEYIRRFEIRHSEELFLLYLNNSENIIEYEANKYIEKNTSRIYKSIITNKLIEKEIDKISKDKSIIKKRKIYSILSDDNKKSLNVEFKNGNERLLCKVESVSWNYINGYITSYNIIGKPNRDKFNKMFSEYRGDAPFDTITKITYGRDVLYERV